MEPRRAASTGRLGLPQATTNDDWATGELSSYFRLHPERLTAHLDTLMNSMRQCGGDMVAFTSEVDTLVGVL